MHGLGPPAFWTCVVGVVLIASLGVIASHIYAFLQDLSEVSAIHSTISSPIVVYGSLLQGLSRPSLAVRAPYLH